MRGLRRGNIMSVYDDEILQQYEQKQKWGKCISYLTSLVDETNFLDVNIRIFIGNSESVNYFFELINDYKRCY